MGTAICEVLSSVVKRSALHHGGNAWLCCMHWLPSAGNGETRSGGGLVQDPKIFCTLIPLIPSVPLVTVPHANGGTRARGCRRLL